MYRVQDGGWFAEEYLKMSQRATNRPSFGMLIRALRMRFGNCPEIGGFMRISGRGPFKVELQPYCLIPAQRGNWKRDTEEKFILWWTGYHQKVITTMPALSGITKVTRQETFWVDDNGECIRQSWKRKR